jgi:hypothetical protein
MTISTQGGVAPAWRGDGSELYYLVTAPPSPVLKMMAVSVSAGATFTAGPPRQLFEAPFTGATANVRGYDVTPDGQRFLLVQQLDRLPQRPAHLVLVQNWLDEVKRLVPAD